MCFSAIKENIIQDRLMENCIKNELYSTISNGITS